MLGAYSTTLPFPSFPQRKSQDCVPPSSPTEPSSHPSCWGPPPGHWDPGWLLRSTSVAGAHARRCPPHQQLQSALATPECHLPSLLVLSFPEAFRLWWNVSALGEVKQERFSGAAPWGSRDIGFPLALSCVNRNHTLKGFFLCAELGVGRHKYSEIALLYHVTVVSSWFCTLLGCYIFFAGFWGSQGFLVCMGLLNQCCCVGMRTGPFCSPSLLTWLYVLCFKCWKLMKALKLGI